MRTLLLPFAVLASLIAGLLVVSQINHISEQNQIRQIQEEARERRERNQRELAELEAKQKAERDALTRKLDEENARCQAILDDLRKRYRTAVENADTEEGRRMEGIIFKAYAATEQGQAEARRRAIAARYVARWNQLYADYGTAIGKGDTEAAKRIREEMETLVRMSRDIK